MLRSIGSGFENAKMLCKIRYIPGPPTKFMKYNNVIAPAIKEVANECMVGAVLSKYCWGCQLAKGD